VPSALAGGTVDAVTVPVGEALERPLPTPARATSGRSRSDDLLLLGGVAAVVLLTLLTPADRPPYPPLLFALVAALVAAASGVRSAHGGLLRARLSLLATLVVFLASLIAAATASSRVAPEPRLGYVLLSVAILPTFGWIAWLTSDSPTRLERRSVWLDIAVLSLSLCAIVIGIAGDALDAFLDVGDALLILSSPALLIAVAAVGAVAAAGSGRPFRPLAASYIVAAGLGCMGVAGLLVAMGVDDVAERLAWGVIALGVLLIGVGSRALRPHGDIAVTTHRGIGTVRRILPVVGVVAASLCLLPFLEPTSDELEQLQTATVVLAVVLIAIRQHLLILEREELLHEATQSAEREHHAHRAAARSIADTRATAERLAEAEARYRALVERIPAVVYVDVIDPASPNEQYRPIYLSPQIEDVSGYPAEAFIADASLWEELIHPDDAVETARLFDRHGRLGEPLRVSYRITHRDGRIVWVEEYASIIGTSPDGHRLSQGVIVDITERRALEDQLRAAQRMDAVGRLAGGVAHDFNNLLTAIVGYASLLLADLPEDDLRRPDVLAITSAADSATVLVRQLLAFGRRQMLRPEEVDLSTVSERVSPMLRRLIGEHIELRTELAPGLPAVRADPGQLEQVVVNLVVNARDAMPDGGTVTIRTHDTVITPLEARAHLGLQPGPYVVLTVTDTGIGMDRATRERVFEPFFTTKEPGRGTGLGLATVYGIVKQSGGYIGVTSEPGHGSSFRVLLPPLPRPVPLTDPAPRGRAALTGGHERILLIEDEEAVRDLASTVLRRVGYDVHEARSGSEGLGVIEARDGAFDLVLTDVVMPGLGGPELARSVRARWPDVGVILMSGYAEEIVGRDTPGEELAFLAKPFAPDGLTTLVRRVLDQRSARPSNASRRATVDAGITIGRSER
jgi:PAS domain S-box-containing protein